MNNQAFFYIDGIPTKGAWIDLDDITDWDEVKSELAKSLGLNADDLDEVLCADVEGLPRHFYASNCDGFSMTDWADFKEQLEATHLDAEVIDAYLENVGTWDVDISHIEEAYYGEYDTFEDFVYQFVEDTCILEGMDDSIRGYFDYEKYGRDLSHDYFESNGHIFRNC